jgi:hypothetical protein
VSDDFELPVEPTPPEEMWWTGDHGARVARREELAARRRRRRRITVAAVALVLVASGAAVLAWASSGDRDPSATAGDGGPGTAAASFSDSSGSEGADPQYGVAGDPAVPSSTTSTAPTTTTTALSDVVVEIGWVGDLTPGSKYGNPPNAGRALFEYTRDHTTQPDVMVANLEGTFGRGGASKCDGRDSSSCYAFQAPPENAAALAWAGIDVVNLANNHSYDYLAAGLASTKEALAANDIAYTGLVDRVAIEEVDGVKVAFIGFSPYSRSPSIADLPAAQELVRRVDQDADIVVVLMHAGAEGADKIHTPKGGETAYGEFRGDSRAFSHAVIDAGADLVMGSGPHVVRGMEEYQGRLVAYSLGNFAGWKNFGRSGNLALSGLLTVRVAGDGRVLGGRWLSLRIADPGVPKVDSGGQSAALVRKLSQEDFATPVVLGDDGTFTFGTQ